MYTPLVENRSSSPIPEEFRPLYKARTAHEALRATINLIQTSDSAKQQQLLKNNDFFRIVDSALAGLDECRIDHLLDIVHSFSKDNQSLGRHVFLGDSN
jgi:hypothetical protein